EVPGEILGGRVPPLKRRMFVDVRVVELLRDRLERFLRRNEIHGDVVALELLGLEHRFDAVRVAGEWVRAAFVVDQVGRRLEAGRNRDAVHQPSTVASRTTDNDAWSGAGIARIASSTFFAVAVSPAAWSMLTSKRSFAPEASVSSESVR